MVGLSLVVQVIVIEVDPRYVTNYLAVVKGIISCVVASYTKPTDGCQRCYYAAIVDCGISSLMSPAGSD